MKKLLYLFVINIFLITKSFALIEIDITRGNLDPLPIAISPLHVDIKSENYDGVQFHAKNNDKKYKIVAIEGMKAFEKNNFNECLKLKDEIVIDILKDLDNPKVDTDTGKHNYDSSGNSKYYRTSISLDSTAKYFNLSISCTDWSKELESEFADKLAVSISNNKFNDYMSTEAYN